MLEANGYTVQKLARRYWITRLAAAGDESLAEDLRVDTTPLRSLADAILADCRHLPRPERSDAFAERFLTPLSRLPQGVVTIPQSKIASWAAATDPLRSRR